MLGHDYYHAIIRKTTAVIGTLFNDITVVRRDASGVEEQRLKVPVVYGPREKYLARIEQDPDLYKKTAVNLPMISFEMTGIRYDESRKLSSIGKFRPSVTGSASTHAGSVFNPVPYDVGYEVSVYANELEDALKIVEQVLPFFTPAWHVSLKMLDSAPEVVTDVYVNLDQVSQEDLYDGSFERRRVVLWRLGLTVKTYFYGPVPTSKVIKIAIVDVYANTGAGTTSAVTVTTTPGMLANGSPTTDPLLSVDPLTIEETDDWDYCIKIEEHDA